MEILSIVSFVVITLIVLLVLRGKKSSEPNRSGSTEEDIKSAIHSGWLVDEDMNIRFRP